MRSYRAATIGLDFAMVSAFVYALDHDKDRMLELSIGTYAFGAPLIHVVKGRNVSALASLGMRVGFPVLGAMLGERLHATPKCVDEGCDEGPHAEVVLGVVLGVGAAMVIDSVYLARGDKPTTTPERTWSPTVRASQGGFALGAAGTF